MTCPANGIMERRFSAFIVTSRTTAAVNIGRDCYKYPGGVFMYLPDL